MLDITSHYLNEFFNNRSKSLFNQLKGSKEKRNVLIAKNLTFASAFVQNVSQFQGICNKFHEIKRLEEKRKRTNSHK